MEILSYIFPKPGQVLWGTLLQPLPRGVDGPGRTARRPPRHQTPGRNKCDGFWACTGCTSEPVPGPQLCSLGEAGPCPEPPDSHRESHWLRGGCCLSSQIVWNMMSVLWEIYANQTSRERSEISHFPWAAIIPGQVCVNHRTCQTNCSCLEATFLPSCLQKLSQLASILQSKNRSPFHAAFSAAGLLAGNCFSEMGCHKGWEVRKAKFWSVTSISDPDL